MRLFRLRKCASVECVSAYLTMGLNDIKIVNTDTHMHLKLKAHDINTTVQSKMKMNA